MTPGFDYPVSPIGFTAFSVPLEAGDDGTAQTVSLIAEAIDEGKRDPTIRAAAIAIVRDTPTNDIDAQARAIYDWAQRNIKYIADGVGVETIQDAAYTMQARGGDCDDFSTLLGSLLGSIGIPVRMITVATNGDDPGFTHIYPEYLSGDGETWIAIDCARSGAAFGRVAEPGMYHRMRVWYLEPAHYDDVAVSGDSQFPGGLQGLISGIKPGAHGLQGFTGLGDDWTDTVDTGSSYDAFNTGVDTINPGDPGFVGPMNPNASIPTTNPSSVTAWTPTAIIQALTVGGNTATNVIRAINTTGLPQNMVAAGYHMSASGQLVGPNGQVYGASAGINLGGISSSTLLFGLLGVGAVAIFAGSRR